MPEGEVRDGSRLRAWIEQDVEREPSKPRWVQFIDRGRAWYGGAMLYVGDDLIAAQLVPDAQD